jgi:hypothetical protein
MFASPGGGGVDVRQTRYGMFTAGIHGLVYYGGLAGCAANYLGINRETLDFWDLSPLEKLAGLPIYVTRTEDPSSFSRYDPRFIRWWRDHMIPDPGEYCCGHTFAELYEKVFMRFFRVMAESYLYLRDADIYAREKNRYALAMKLPDFEALSYLETKFGESLGEYRVEEDGTGMTVSMAVGFWIRRGIDRTDFELWLALRKVMKLYDGLWFEGLREKYPRAKYLLI